MAKRKSDIPLVEKLYRENLGTFEASGGFCDDDDQVAERREELAQKRQRRLADRVPALPSQDCQLCSKPVLDSFLWDRFGHPVCDKCRDDKGIHKLISRTEALSTYLLKDTDLDLRKPPLRYISRKNPHNPRYGDMKLYVTCQVVDRMLEVHGSHEKLEEAKRAKDEKREVLGEKRFEKKVKEMRKQIRGAIKQQAIPTRAHVHSFGEDQEDSKTGDWKHECTECGYVESFEKM